jgi:phospholipid transport system transporter-binding protein
LRAVHPLSSTLTIAEASTALDALESALGESGSAVFEVDAAALQRFDSSAIAVLLEARRQTQTRGRSLVVHNAPATMVALAGMYGVAELLGLAQQSA